MGRYSCSCNRMWNQMEAIMTMSDTARSIAESINTKKEISNNI